MMSPERAPRSRRDDQGERERTTPAAAWIGRLAVGNRASLYHLKIQLVTDRKRATRLNASLKISHRPARHRIKTG